MQSDYEDAEEPIWKQLLRRFGIFLGLFVAGATFAFAYSYIPLHNSKNWQIERLTERLDVKSELLRVAEERIAVEESESTGRPDAETFKMLQDELASADKTIKGFEKKLSKNKTRIAELERSRNNWKSKYKKADGDLARAIATPKPPSTAAPASPAPAMAQNESSRPNSGLADQSQGGTPEPLKIEIEPNVLQAEDAEGH